MDERGTNSLTQSLAVQKPAFLNPNLLRWTEGPQLSGKSTSSYKSNSDLIRLELFLMSRASAGCSGGTGKVRCLARQLDSGTQNTSSKTYSSSFWAAPESRANISLYIYFLPSSVSWIVLIGEKDAVASSALCNLMSRLALNQFVRTGAECPPDSGSCSGSGFQR